jgi:hypothetical protein
MQNEFKVIEAFWRDLLHEFEKTESEELLKVIKFVDKEVSN